MSVVARERAQEEQLRASDPAVSAFVSASAGSGKTKLLTDRLLRLMLNGSDPARIQCLTFTRAAAAEMAVRLQRRLGAWVTMDDTKLDAELRALKVTPTEAGRTAARALFARVLDLPGGMRIGTIHAFCQSLLRRFPLEAQLSPHFALVDDTDAEIALRDAREDMLAHAYKGEMQAALEDLAGLTSADQFGGLVARLLSERDKLRGALALGENLPAAQRRALGAKGTDEEIVARAVTWAAEDTLRRGLEVVAQKASPVTAEKAHGILAWLSLDVEARVENWAEWRSAFLREDGPRGMGAIVNKKLQDSRPDIVAAVEAEQARISAVEDDRRTLRVAAVSAALMTLARPVVEAYARHKDDIAQLDYDDLIGRTSALLVDPGAAWVLYKLDGGLDHLLLDEVQDTAPAQWKIAGALTEEFFTGEGARDGSRTVFAVGDHKQSIYSFQGADPDEFDRWQNILKQRVEAAGEKWRGVTLDVSFRSTAPVLRLVDAVFAAPPACEGVTAATLTHIADRAGHAGRVELWPLAPIPVATEPAPWAVPDANAGAIGAPQRLAETIAEWIAEACGKVDLPARGRKLAAGDVLVLVRRRNAFARALVRALKARGVPVAGLDRLVLTEQPVVADLLALCDVLLLPQDDLQLACVLTSPLGGLADDDLLALAPSRRGSLWDALRARAEEQPHWTAARDFIATLMGRVDFSPPHALLAEALGPLGGRARLFARLGPEAAEPVDELLNAALTYAQAHAPSLQGFVHWMRQSGAEVKREAEGAGQAVRIMTVHGAKGLQAPLVILPDTTALPPDDATVFWADDVVTGASVPLWSPRKELRCAAVDTLRTTAAARRAEEHNRLLYVALTRAEDRLIVCGWETAKAPPETCWYELVRQGFGRLSSDATAFTAWDGEMLSLESAQDVLPVLAHGGAVTAPPPALPCWAGRAPDWTAAPPPAEPDLPSPLAPSRPENAALGLVPQAESPLAERDATGTRFLRGQLVHALLQHLPAVQEQDREGAARRYLSAGHGLTDAAVSDVVADVFAVLGDAELAPLFGPDGRAEVPLTGVIGGAVIGGLVDRLAVFPDRVMVADYKTNRAPPTSATAAPLLYLRQMAAYRAVLAEIFPGRTIDCALVWTTGGKIMWLPQALLDRHAPGAMVAA